MVDTGSGASWPALGSLRPVPVSARQFVGMVLRGNCYAIAQTRSAGLAGH